MDDLVIEYGYKWDPRERYLAPGTHSPGAPWPEEFARSVYAGETKFPDALTVLVGGVENPSAAIWMVPNDYALVDFFDDEGQATRSYNLLTFRPGYTDIFPEGSVEVEGMFFLRSATAYRRHEVTGVAVEDHRRAFSTDGRTKLGKRLAFERSVLEHQQYERERSWWDDPAVDRDAAGLWEPVPEFGDWAGLLRFDRPGIPIGPTT